MTQLFLVILSLSVSGGLVGLLVLAFRPAAGHYFSKRWAYCLWLLVIARLLVPVHVDINLMAYLSAAGSSLSQAGSEAELDGRAATVLEGLPDESESAGNTTNGRRAGSELHETGGMAAADGTEGSAWKQILQRAALIWFAGVLFTVLRKLWIYRRFVKGVCAVCVPVTDRRILGQYAQIQKRVGVQKIMPLYESADIDSPMLIGLFNPCICLPTGLLGKMTGKENDVGLILHHELVHYKRRDLWYKWLFQAALCVHWFNPLVYVFNRKFSIDCELACDETMMKLLSEEGRRAYGNVLLDVAQKSWSEGTFWGKDLGTHRNVPAMTLLEEKSTLKERLRGIAQYHQTGIVVGLCSVAALVMFLSVALVCGAADVHGNYGKTISMYNSGSFAGNLAEHFWENTMWSEMWGDSFNLDQPIHVSKNGKAYRMYDDDAMIAGESENDWWRARTYIGGDKSVDAKNLMLNGSDALWILYANKETTLEISSRVHLFDGRFKLVWVGPDQTVQTLNENGEENVVKITLPQGRNVIKMVGQKAKLEDLNVAYAGMKKGDFDGIYNSEASEYAYQVLERKRPFDPARLEEVCPQLKEKEVSELCRIALEEGTALSKKNWQDLFVYSNEKLTARYLLEALQAGRAGTFDSGILVGIAPYMTEADMSECFRQLLERDAVSGSDWESIFVYSDANKSAGYLAEALRKGKATSFSDKALEKICYRVSAKELTDIVTAMDEMSFDSLKQVLAYVQQMDEAVTCVYHYIDLGNALTDDQLREIGTFLSKEDFYRVVEYNGRKK